MSMNEDFVRYNRRVRYLTECTLKENGITVDNRFCYNIDHIFPIKRGYELGIPERLIASLDNLQIMDWKLNRKKFYRRSNSSVLDLFCNYGGNYLLPKQ